MSLDSSALNQILEQVANGMLSPQEAYSQLKVLTFDDIGFAKLDHYRKSRQGIPEVIYCPGKTPSQIVAIVHAMLAHHSLVLATRIEPEKARQVLSIIPDGHYDETAQMLVFGTIQEADSEFVVSVVTAGTADLPAAEEAALYLVSHGIKVQKVYDVGVAGIHRLFPYLENLNKSAVVIVVAGMDGALPSVIGGLIASPIIAVPASIGYGANFEGLSALLTMLNSCAAGLTVVNIDNGFGAAVAAMRILSRLEAKALTEQPKSK
jgi:NCAIR mutase (PurE)-related protein